MPTRTQRTPFGDVSVTSRWMKGRYYYLVVTGPHEAVRWLFPTRAGGMEIVSSTTSRIVFPPIDAPVTVERDLRTICANWQDIWNQRFQDYQNGHDIVQQQTGTATAAVRPRTVGQMIEAFIQVRRDQIKGSTWFKERDYLTAWIKALRSDRPLESLVGDDLLAARRTLMKERAVSTVNCMAAVLKTCFKWAVGKGYLASPIHDVLKKLKEARNFHESSWWTMSEVELALRCAAADEHQPTATLFVAICCLLGLRKEEAVMLRWQDCDLDRKDPEGRPTPVVHICAHDSWQPKDSETRTIPVCDRLLGILRQHRRPTGFLLESSGKGYAKRGGVRRVYRYDPNAVWKRIIARVEEAGGRRITVHQMRHSFTTNLITTGAPDLLVARWLGHADTRMISQRYGHTKAYDASINLMTRGTSAPTAPGSDPDVRPDPTPPKTTS